MILFSVSTGKSIGDHLVRFSHLARSFLSKISSSGRKRKNRYIYCILASHHRFLPLGWCCSSAFWRTKNWWEQRNCFPRLGSDRINAIFNFILCKILANHSDRRGNTFAVAVRELLRVNPPERLAKAEEDFDWRFYDPEYLPDRSWERPVHLFYHC